MHETPEEKLIQKTYRDYLTEEVQSPEVQQAKKEFIEKHFMKEPLFIMKPAVSLSLAVLVAVGLLAAFLFWFKPVPVREPAPQPAIKQTVEIPKALTPGSIVEVKRVASAVGPTMVYQKVAEGLPVTIIWVFNGRSVQ